MSRTGTERYRAFLGHPGARRLLISSLIARLPAGMSSLAILLLVREQTGSFAPAGLAVGAFTLTAAAAAPVQGALVDRHGARMVLMPLALAQAAALIALVAAAQSHLATAGVALIAAIAGATFPPVDACIRVLWPVVAPDPAALEAAYQLDATSQEVIWTGGPLLVAGAVAWGSPAAAVVTIAAIGVGGTLLFTSAPLARHSPARSRDPRRESLVRSPGLRVLFASCVLMGVGIGAVEVGLTALAVDAGQRGAAGLLLGLWSIGSMAGGFVYGLRSWSTPSAERYPILLLVIAVGTAPLIVAHSLAVAAPLSLLAGVGYAPMLACQYLLIGRLAPRAAAAEAFMWASAGLIAGLAAGSAISGPLVQNVGVASSFALSCGVTTIAAIAARGGRSRLERPARGAAPADARP